MSSGHNYLINLMPCTNQGHPLSVVRILVFPEVSQMVYGTGSSPYRLWRFCATSERPRRHKTKLVTIIGQLLIYIYNVYIYIHNVNIYIYGYILYTLQMIHTHCNTTTVHHGTSAFMATGHRGHWGGRGRRRGGRGQGLFTWGSSKWLGDDVVTTLW